MTHLQLTHSRRMLWIASPFLILTIALEPRIAAASGSCDSTIQKAEFRASFDWQAEAASPKRKMRIILGSSTGAKGTSAASSIAKILDRGRCIAVCTLRNAADPKGQTRAIASLSFPEAIDMECEAPQLSGLTSPASLIFRTEQGTSILRFGSWLRGYRDAKLKVEANQLSGS